jgi:hypothetical protein
VKPAWTIIFALALLPLAATGANPLLRGTTLQQLTSISANDGIPSGWCGRAMLSLLTKSGLGKGLKPGNGQDWEQILRGAGWKPLRVSSPFRAPLGSVLVYSSDRTVGKLPRGTPGGYFGHVEMVSLSESGSRVYVADSPRVAPGGSVPDNFTGRAWVPPGTLLSAPAPIAAQIDTIMEERFKMAQTYFDERRTVTASLQPGDQSVRIR